MRCSMSMCPTEAIETLKISNTFLDKAGHRHQDSEKHTVSLCAKHLQLLNEGKLRPKG